MWKEVGERKEGLVKIRKKGEIEIMVRFISM